MDPVDVGSVYVDDALRFVQFILFQLFVTPIVLVAFRRLALTATPLVLILATAFLSIAVTAATFVPTVVTVVLLPLALGCAPGVISFLAVSVAFDHFVPEGETTRATRILVFISVVLSVVLYGLHFMMVAVPTSALLLVTLIHVAVAAVLFGVAHGVARRFIETGARNLWAVLGCMYCLGFLAAMLALTLGRNIGLFTLVTVLVYCLSLGAAFSLMFFTSRDVQGAASELFANVPPAVVPMSSVLLAPELMHHSPQTDSALSASTNDVGRKIMNFFNEQ